MEKFIRKVIRWTYMTHLTLIHYPQLRVGRVQAHRRSPGIELLWGEVGTENNGSFYLPPGTFGGELVDQLLVGTRKNFETRYGDFIVMKANLHFRVKWRLRGPTIAVRFETP